MGRSLNRSRAIKTISTRCFLIFEIDVARLTRRWFGLGWAIVVPILLCLCLPAQAQKRSASAQVSDAFVEQQLKALKKSSQKPTETPQNAAPKATGEAPVNLITLASGGAALAVVAEPLSDGLRLRYDWDKAVRAGAVIYGDTLWVAFDGVREIDHRRAETLLRPRILGYAQVGVVAGTVVRYRLRPDSFVGMRRDGNSWIVTLKEQQILPRIGLSAQLVQDPVAGSQRFIRAESPGEVLRLRDPATGQTVFLATISGDSAGVSESVDLPDARLLASAQGVAMLALTPKAQMVRNETGYALLYSDGTAVVPAQRQPLAQTALSLGSGVEKPRTGGFMPLLDVEAWKKLAPGRFSSARATLYHRLSLAGQNERQARRWDVARFFLAHAFYADAYGVLSLMARADSNLLNIPQFRIARGIAALKLRKWSEAAEDLGQLSLDVEPEIWLWRSQLFLAQGLKAEALDAYARGSDVLGKLPADMRFRFQIPIIETALDAGQLPLAARELDLLPLDISTQQKSEALYWRGRLALAQSKIEDAIKLFDQAQKQAEENKDIRLMAMARFERVNTALDAQKISPEQAIATLDPLRFAWRGDAFELRLLDRLARLYEEKGRYREALVSLRTGVNYFKPNDTTRAMARRMDTLFVDLFLNGKADSLEPSKALAIFADFRELVPLGAEGDTMIRALADRLVQVDLLDRAGGLLQHQVLYRLEGAAQAQVATRLAMIRLLDNKPALALEVLRMTRQEVMLEDLRLQRNRIEARALIDLNRLDEAQAILEEDKTPAADILRSDIYWIGRDWKKLADLGEAILERRQNQAQALDEDDRRQVIRTALALSLSNQTERLNRLRTRYGPRMATGSYAAAFNVLTSTQQINVSDIQSLSKTLEGVDRLQSVLDAYRNEFKSAIRAPAAAQTSANPQPASTAPAG
jgi:tetratricopeptide (TPR) repeat protein